MALVVLLCGVSGVAQAYDVDELCTSDGKHVIAFTPYEGMRLDGKLLPPWVAADKDFFGFILVWKGLSRPARQALTLPSRRSGALRTAQSSHKQAQPLF